MRLDNRDLKKLAPPLALVLVLFGIGGTLAWTAQSTAETARMARDRAAESKSRIEIRLRQFRSEEPEIKDRGLLLQRLQTLGILGEEQRIDWMEQLRNTQRELRIPGMKYEFSPQKPLPMGSPAGNTWFNSSLHIQLRLLHEGDLLNFLTRIQQDAKALTIVRTCKLAPPPNVGNDRESTGGLLADCEIDWLTARTRGGNG